MNNKCKGLLHIPATDLNFIHGIKELRFEELQEMYVALNDLEKTEHGHIGRITAVAKEMRSRKKEANEAYISCQDGKIDVKTESGAVLLHGKQFMGVRDANKLAAIFTEIAENEKAAVKLLAKTARAYYDAGNILTAALRHFDHRVPHMGLKAFSEAVGFPERHIRLALKIFKHFENNPDALKGLELREALKLIAPPPPAGEEGLNRVDLGGDPGQMKFDFGELFERPAVTNQSLMNYRTAGDLLSEIIVVRRTADGGLVSKCFNRFHEDIPQNPTLRLAYKTMSQKTQAAIEDYLAALEQEEVF
ncbi:MAG: hypothetical protein LBQ93_06845 [Treponema sp.]|nr:hypothetical protein [Treponema sp.]